MIVVEFTIPAESFPLGRLLRATADLRIELQPSIPLHHEFIPFLWAEGSTEILDGLEKRVRRDDRVSSLERLGKDGTGNFYRIHWERIIDGGLIGHCQSNGLHVQRASGTGDDWSFNLIAEERHTSGLRELIGTREFPVAVNRLESGISRTRLGSDEAILTPLQRETLAVALDEGYFEIPREITLEELGTVFDISRQATTRRLQRGLRRLVEDHCELHRR